MKVSYNWLRELLEFDLSPQQLGDLLTAAGFPVEDIQPVASGIDGVIVGKLLEVSPHPDADRLSLTRVSDGREVYQVVCGAANIAVGDKVPFAPVGALLPGNLKIKKAKIRGQVSLGMLCSAQELNLELVQAEEGILQLPKSARPGQSLAACLGLDDFILDVELTANRADCLSIRGLTAEIAANLGRRFALPLPPAPAGEKMDFPIVLETDACPRYTGRLLKGIKVKPSPLWLQLRLLACGMRPINNIVDITNLVMLEWGQPLHAFDADKLPQLGIGVRQARPGETMVTLDKKTRQLTPEMMLITSGDKPVAIAGVMGSLDSEVDQNTTNILLESADFDALSVRKTAKALGIVSEAASRFEKGVDPSVVTTASDRAAQLVVDLAGGRVGKLVDAGRDRAKTWAVAVDLDRVNGLLGTEIAPDEAMTILNNLGLAVRAEGRQLQVTVDGRRGDLVLEEDIAEELGRLHGLDKVPATLPAGRLTLGARTRRQQLAWLVRDVLVGCGLYEIIPYSFIGPEAAERSRCSAGVPIANPITRERSLMRGCMLPSLLETVNYNLAHGRQSVAIFELGDVYLADPDGGLAQQRARVAGALAGKDRVHWQQARQYDFYTCKGVVEELLAALNIEASFARAGHAAFHPGRCAVVKAGQTELGLVGQVHPSIGKYWKLDQPVWVFDLDFAALVTVGAGKLVFSPPSRYPAIRRDLALEVAEAVEAATLVEIITTAGGDLLEKVDCFDLYTGPNLGEGKKSLAFALTFRHPARTLTDSEVQKLLDDMVEKMARIGVRLRG